VNTSRLGVIHHAIHALVLFGIHQYTKFEVPSFISYKDMIGPKPKNESLDSDHAPCRDGLLQ